MKISKRNTFRLIWFTIVILFSCWQWSTYQSRNLPANTFENDSEITVEISADKITFSPTRKTNQHEIIFFQGGMTDPKAYAPLCKQIAAKGYICHLIKMDWRMPIWDYNKIKQMFDLKNGHYILGGHSQGAKMAAQFVYEHPKEIEGLFLLGTSHPRDYDLSDRSIPTLKLHASDDGLASTAEVMENKGKLPQNATLVEIAGGNHSQFGYLGTLLTDNTAKISLQDQQQLTIKYLVEFFNTVKHGNKN